MAARTCPGAPLPKPHLAVGLTILRAPGGGLVLVSGPIDLSKAKSLSPAWTREKLATRPEQVTLAPNKENGRRAVITVPVLQRIGSERVHGESSHRTAARANQELAALVDAAFMGAEVPLEVLEGLIQPEPKVEPVEPVHSAQMKREHAERAMGFTGLADAEVRRRLLAMGRRKGDVDKYIAERRAAAA